MKVLILRNYQKRRNRNIFKLKNELSSKGVQYDIGYASKLINPDGYDFIINKANSFLNPTYSNLMEVSHKVFNKPNVSVICHNKWKTYQLFEGQVLQPLTQETPEGLNYPIIIKDRFGSFGRQVYKADNEDQLKLIMDTYFPGHDATRAIFQEFSPCNNCHYRIMVIGNEVIGGMKVTAQEGNFRSNVHLGGNYEKFTPTPEMAAMALQCQELLGAGYVGYDLLLGENGQLYLCEANANAYTNAFDKVTEINTTNNIIEILFTQVEQKENLPRAERKGRGAFKKGRSGEQDGSLSTSALRRSAAESCDRACCYQPPAGPFT